MNHPLHQTASGPTHEATTPLVAPHESDSTRCSKSSPAHKPLLDSQGDERVQTGRDRATPSADRMHSERRARPANGEAIASRMTLSSRRLEEQRQAARIRANPGRYLIAQAPANVLAKALAKRLLADLRQLVASAGVRG